MHESLCALPTMGGSSTTSTTSTLDVPTPKPTQDPPPRSAWFWKHGAPQGKSQARDARGRFLPKPSSVVEEAGPSGTPFFSTFPLYFMSPLFSPMSQLGLCPPNLVSSMSKQPSSLWSTGAHASLATRCLHLLDAIASVVLEAPPPHHHGKALDHTIFTQPPFDDATSSFPCLVVDPMAVASHPHMELSKGYLRLWLTTHTKKGSRASEYAHRLVLWSIRGPPSPTLGGWQGAVAMHKCHNPLCVHPCHLKWGTRQENLADRPL